MEFTVNSRLFLKSFQYVPDREPRPTNQVGVNPVTEPFLPFGRYPFLADNRSDLTGDNEPISPQVSCLSRRPRLAIAGQL